MTRARRPSPCPRCGSRAISEVVFDAADALDPSDDGKPVLLRHGDPTGSRPKWHCAVCGYEWGYPKGFSGSSSPDADLA